MQIMKPGALSILSELAKGYLKSQVLFYSMVTGIISEKEQCCLVGALFFSSPFRKYIVFRLCCFRSLSLPVQC